MSSKAITERQDERRGDGPAGGLAPVTDVGPSLVREEEAGLPRVLGMIGAVLVIVFGMALGFNVARPGAVRVLFGIPVGPGISLLMLSIGLAGLLFHSAFDRDVQVRRTYMAFGFVTLGLGVILAAVSIIQSARATAETAGTVPGLFRWGVPCIGVSLLFLLAHLRNETEAKLRDVVQLVIGIAGVVMALVGLVGGMISGDFLLPVGLILSILGLIFLTAFVGSRGISDDTAYYAAVVLGVLGLLVVLVSLGRTMFSEAGTRYFTSFGSILLLVGLGYGLTGACLASDSPLLVLLRRELGSFFFSPIAYLSLIGFTFVAWISYMQWMSQLITLESRRQALSEPIVQSYIFGLFPVISLILVVPILTMRLFSEESRSGTLEVLFTAPVDETAVVFSKFIAALITFLLVWVPFGLYLAVIPLSGGNPFDYRPLLSFGLVLTVTGSAFVSAGVFFSSLSRSQIASGVLTAAFMMLLTFVYFPLQILPEGSAWHTVLRHMSYLNLWYASLEGTIVPKYLLFFLSLTVLFLFMTVKVLESRKWR